VHVTHHTVQHFHWDSGDFFSNSQFRFGNILWAMSINVALQVAPQKESQADKSGDLAGQ
jgi:hypothetical protein